VQCKVRLSLVTISRTDITNTYETVINCERVVLTCHYFIVIMLLLIKSCRWTLRCCSL